MDILTLGVPEFAMAVLGLSGVAFVKLVDLLFDKDWKGASKIVGSAILGVLIALFVDGLGVVQGAVLLMSMSGVITIAPYIGKQSVKVEPPVQG